MLIKIRSFELDVSLSGRSVFLRLGSREWYFSKYPTGRWQLNP